MHPLVVVFFVAGITQLLTATPIYRREIIADNRRQFLTSTEVLKTTSPHVLREKGSRDLETTTHSMFEDVIGVAHEVSIQLSSEMNPRSLGAQNDSSQTKINSSETLSISTESSNTPIENPILISESFHYTPDVSRHAYENLEIVSDKSRYKDMEYTPDSTLPSKVSQNTSNHSIVSSLQSLYGSSDAPSLQFSSFFISPLSAGYNFTSENPLLLSGSSFEDPTTTGSESEFSTQSLVAANNTTDTNVILEYYLEDTFETTNPLSVHEDSSSLCKPFSTECSTIASEASEHYSTSQTYMLETMYSSVSSSEILHNTSELPATLSDDLISFTVASQSEKENSTAVSNHVTDVQKPASESVNISSDPAFQTHFSSVVSTARVSDISVKVSESSTQANINVSVTPSYDFTNTSSETLSEVDYPLFDTSTKTKSILLATLFSSPEIPLSMLEPTTENLNSIMGLDFDASPPTPETFTSTTQTPDDIYSSEDLLKISKDLDKLSYLSTYSLKVTNPSYEAQSISFSKSENLETPYEYRTLSSYMSIPISNIRLNPSNLFVSTTKETTPSFEGSVTLDLPTSSHKTKHSLFGVSLKTFPDSKQPNEAFTSSDIPTLYQALFAQSEVRNLHTETSTLSYDEASIYNEAMDSSESSLEIHYPKSEPLKMTTVANYSSETSFSPLVSLKPKSKAQNPLHETSTFTSETSTASMSELLIFNSDVTAEDLSSPTELFEFSSLEKLPSEVSMSSNSPLQKYDIPIFYSTAETSEHPIELQSESLLKTSDITRFSSEVLESTTKASMDWLLHLANITVSTISTNGTGSKEINMQVTIETKNSGKSYYCDILFPFMLLTLISIVNLTT